MELAKTIINILLENRVDFKFENHNQFQVCIEFDIEENFDIDYLTINIETDYITVNNFDTSLWLRRINSIEELKQFTPFKQEQS